MAAENDGTLSTEAQIIRDETNAGANTATRVGTHLLNMISSKVNWTQVDTDVTLANNADERVASQKAIKAYVDAGGATVKVKVSISSAEILNMNSSPVELVAAQGAGTIIQPLHLLIRKNFVSVAYTTNLNVQFAPNTMFSDTRSNFLDFTETEFYNYQIETGTDFSEASAGIDTPINLFVTGANPVAGNGTLDIYLIYTVITL